MHLSIRAVGRPAFNIQISLTWPALSTFHCCTYLIFCTLNSRSERFEISTMGNIRRKFCLEMHGLHLYAFVLRAHYAEVVGPLSGLPRDLFFCSSKLKRALQGFQKMISARPLVWLKHEHTFWHVIYQVSKINASQEMERN